MKRPPLGARRSAEDLGSALPTRAPGDRLGRGAGLRRELDLRRRNRSHAAYLGYLDPELNDEVAALTPRYLREPGYLRLYFPEGEVDFIAAAPVTRESWRTETVLDRRVLVDTSIEIVGKKIRYRGEHFTARDVFDFALVAEKEPKRLPRLHPVLRERREVLLERLASADKILRTTFKQLETLHYRPAYDHCVEIVKKAVKNSEKNQD